MTFLIIIVLVGVIFWLHRRVSNLEEQMQAGVSQQRSTQTKVSSIPAAVPVQQTHEPQAPIVEDQGPTAMDKFVEWAKEDWLLKLGALLLLIGFGWLVSFAFANNWIGPAGRIALGLIGGVLILLLGWWRVKKYVYQGSTFLVLGSSVILLTTFAARELYDFFTPLVALGIMFLSVAFVALASVKYRHLPLAIASLVVAGITPLLTNFSSGDVVSLFLYLLVVTIGTIWIVGITGWRILTAAALTLVALYSLPHLSSVGSANQDILLLFSFVFTAIFFVTSILGILKLKKNEIIPDLITAGGTGLFLLVWIMVAAPDEWKSLIMVAWMLVFGVGGFIAFRLTQRFEPFYIYLGVSIAMLAAATSVELNGATLVIAYAVESGIISLVTYAVLKNLRTAQALSLLMVGPIFLSFQSLTSRAWNTSVFNKDFFVLLVLAIILFGLGLFFWWMHGRIKVVQKDEMHFNVVLLIVGSIYVYALLWLSLHATSLSNDIATMVSLIIYTIIGLAIYFYGRVQEKKVMQIYGAVLLTVVVGRLVVIDVWGMALSGRIITFFVVGALLTTTAFFGRKKHDKPVESTKQVNRPLQ